MEKELATKMNEVKALVDEYRVRCLWFLHEDYYPETPEQAIRVLEAIEKHGDAAAFKKAATLRQWLSHRFNAPSAK